MQKFLVALALTIALAAIPVYAGTIDVLWYTGGVNGASYQTDINNLAALAPGAPGGNTWNVTYWASGAMPAGSFNVLVVASAEGGWGPYPDYTALNSAALSFNPAAQRVMITGQDADWHYINYPGGASFDGPQGFLLDSINWAGSGSGMGLVDLGQDGMGGCYGGASISTGGGFTTVACGTDNVVIPGGVASNPVNTGLTSAGLSNWSTSSHNQYTNLSSVWDGINIDGNYSGGYSGTDATCATATPDAGCVYVTIVSANAVGGTITPTPEPAGLLLLGSAAAVAAGLIRRKKRA